MSEKTAEYKTNAPEKYEVEELVDDAIAAGGWSPQMRNEYVYTFKQGGREIRGLTSAAIAHIALEHGISITNIEKEILKDGVLFTATAVKKMPDLEDCLTAYGCAYQPFLSGGKPDVFCWQKALTKACRNARRQLIPATMIISATEQLLNLTPGVKPKPQAIDSGEAPIEKADDSNDPDELLKRATRECFATYRENKARLEKRNISEYLFWECVRERYNVLSSKGMKREQFKEVTHALRENPFPKWMRDFAYPDIRVNVKARLRELVDEKIITVDAFYERLEKRTGVKNRAFKVNDWKQGLELIDEIVDESNDEKEVENV